MTEQETKNSLLRIAQLARKQIEQHQDAIAELVLIEEEALSSVREPKVKMVIESYGKRWG